MDTFLDNATIGAFAQAAGVGVETIRFYQRKGLLPRPARPQGGVRRYGPADLARVRFIKTSQRLGFNLDEVAELLRLDDGTRCGEARALASHKLADVRQKMADLEQIEQVLAELVERCAAGSGKVSCPIIASLRGPAIPTGTAAARAPEKR